MPVRSTLNSSKALQMGFGIQEGRVLVDDARFKVVQRTRSEKKGGGLVTPMLFLEFDCKRVNENNVAESDAIETTDLLLAFGSKEAASEGDNAGLHSFALWPGNIKGDPSDPTSEVESLHVDMADDKRAYVRIDTEGNTFVSADGAVPFADSEAMLFMKSLEARGWKPEINDQAFAGNYRGAIFDVKTVLKEDLCKRLGVKYNPPSGANADPNRPPTVWEVTAIHVRPYEQKGKGAAAGKGSAAGKKAEKPADSKTNGAAGAAVAAVGDSNIDAKIKSALEDFVKTKSGTTMTQLDMQKALGPVFMKAAGLSQAQAFINTQVKPIEALATLGFEFGFEVDPEAKTVTFG